MGGITQQMPRLVYDILQKKNQFPCPSFELLCTTSISDVTAKFNNINFSYHQYRSSLHCPYEGAIVVREPRVYSNVAVFDFESLYPSYIQLQNKSFETRIVRPNQLTLFPHDVQRFSRNTYFCEAKTMFTRTDVEGIIPQIMKHFKSVRKEVKLEMKKLQNAIKHVSANEQREAMLARIQQLDIQQLVCKLMPRE